MSLWMKSYGVTIQMKATEQYFTLVLVIVLYKLFPQTFESVDEFLWCDHSKKATVQYFRVVLTFESVIDKILKQNEGFQAALPYCDILYNANKS